MSRMAIPSASVVACVSKELLRKFAPSQIGSMLSVENDPCNYVVCILKRSPKSSFMPAALVFPGGALEPEDQAYAASLPISTRNDDPLADRKVCSLRETFEESGLCLLDGADSSTFKSKEDCLEWRHRVHNDATQWNLLMASKAGLTTPLSGLHPLCRFVTPDAEAARGGKGFDASFFLSVVTGEQLQSSLALGADRKETTKMLWASPASVFEMMEKGTAFVVRMVMLDRREGNTDRPCGVWFWCPVLTICFVVCCMWCDRRRHHSIAFWMPCQKCTTWQTCHNSVDEVTNVLFDPALRPTLDLMSVSSSDENRCWCLTIFFVLRCTADRYVDRELPWKPHPTMLDEDSTEVFARGHWFRHAQIDCVPFGCMIFAIAL